MSDTLRVGLPKGRMEASVQQLLFAAGIHVTPSARNYRPQISLPLAEAKIQKPQNVIEMLAIGWRAMARTASAARLTGSTAV